MEVLIIGGGGRYSVGHLPRLLFVQTLGRLGVDLDAAGLVVTQAFVGEQAAGEFGQFLDYGLVEAIPEPASMPIWSNDYRNRHRRERR